MRYAWMVIVVVLVGCAASSRGTGAGGGAGPGGGAAGKAGSASVGSAATSSSSSSASSGGSGGLANGTGGAVALVDGQIVSSAQVMPLLIEASGATVLGEYVLDVRLGRELVKRKMVLTDADIEAEKQVMLGELSGDRDQALRLLERVREQRGLGPVRYAMLLRRNAGLRKLVASEVVVNDGMIKAAYEQRYGPKVSARMILVATLGEAQRVMERLGRGEAFMDVAIDVSLDASRNQGGLLPDISPQDATFPKAIREAVRGLEPGQITPPVAMESGFAVLKVERKIVPQAPAMESVAAELKRQVTLTAQRAAMERQARVLIDEADVTVLDAALNEAYGRQRRDIVGPR